MVARKSFIPVLAALVMGLFAAVLANHWLQTRIAAAEAEQRAGTAVVVAAADIAFGDKIQPQHLALLYWPRDQAPDGVFHEIAAVAGHIANQKLVAGEIILQSRVALHGGGNSLSAMIEPSKRAVTVRVNDVIGVAGFLLPGNRVDVLATRVHDDKRARTHTLLQNRKVLAVDQTAQADKDKPTVVRAVTLELEPSEAEELVSATEEGTVQLALRNPDDVQIHEAVAQTVPVPAVVAQAAPAAVPPAVPRPRIRPKPPVPAPAPAPADDSQTVTVIRQSQVGQSLVKLQDQAPLTP